LETGAGLEPAWAAAQPMVYRTATRVRARFLRHSDPSYAHYKAG